VPLPKFIGNCQRREDVATGAAPAYD